MSRRSSRWTDIRCRSGMRAPSWAIFIHWGLYSVPGWAPLTHPDHDFSSNDYIKYDPYAEWYLNTMRIPGSPTQEYHKQHYGDDRATTISRPTFNRESKKWNPDEMAHDFSGCWRALRGADKQASRRLHALAEHDPQSDAEPEAEPTACRARHCRRVDHGRSEARTEDGSLLLRRVRLDLQHRPHSRSTQTTTP